MKIKKAVIVVFTLGIAWSALAVLLTEKIQAATSSITDSDLPFPSDMECSAQPFYRFRADGKPGREIVLNLKGDKLFGNAQIEIAVDGSRETTKVPPVVGGASSYRVLLPPNVAVTAEAQVTLTLRRGERNLTKTVTVPPMRQWTVYLYPHSHVDIGYTAPQSIVEFIHKRNIIEGIKLAEATKDYPEGSRYRWNPEVTWPVERLWQSMPEEREHVLKAIRDGQLCVDASYANLNTSVCCDEELFQIFHFSREIQQRTGVPMDTFQQMDVPGMSWGLVPVMAQLGVHYIMAWPNPGRSGNTHDRIDQHPFWWIGPDGKSKVLFLQPGSYCNSGSSGKGATTGRPWFGQRDIDRIPNFIKTGSANVDFTKLLANAEKAKFPYDFMVLSWCLWDNSVIDADVPDAVKAWNDQHAYPHIVIAGGHQIMSEIERKYGDRLPKVRGDFTEYWTDGQGTGARQSALNRNSKERLTQAETLWTMLRPGRPAPRADFDEAWRYVELADEHTWAAENVTEPFFQKAIWKIKQSYFREADDRSQTLLDDALAPATDKSNGGLGLADGPAQGGVAVFNTHSWKHGGLITLSPEESVRGDRVVDEQGRDLPAQRLSTGELAFLASDVPALGSRHFRVVKGASPLADGCVLDGTTLENKHLHVVLDPVTGDITQLVDLTSGHNFADAKVNGGLNAFRWLPGKRNEPKADTDIVISTVESGPLVVELRVSSQGTGCRSVSRSVRLVAGEPWVEITDVVDKLPLLAKDGVHFGFGFDIPRGRTRFDIPWGVTEVEKDQLPQANRNWIALQHWLDISNDNEGVTWCSLDAPLFEYGAMTANIVTNFADGRIWEDIPWIKKLQPSSTVYSWAMNNHWFTNFPTTQDGPVTFRYRILPHGGYDAAAANRFGLEQAQPLAHVLANRDPKLNPLVAVDNERVFVTVIKASGTGKVSILRLRSVSDKPETTKLAWPAGQPKSVRLCPLGETLGEPVGGDLSLLPYGSITLGVEFN